MMGQFDDETDPLGGVTLEPSPVLDAVGQQSVPLPDPSPIISAMPRLPPAPPVPLPPQPMQDPKQRLLALFATAFALGAGPQSGAGAGALHGLNLGSQALQQQDMLRWKVQANEAEKQQSIVAQQQAELDKQRALKLQTTFENFRKDLAKTTSEEDYQKLVGMYAGGLQAAGYRIPPDYFYQNFKFTPPTDQQQIQQKLSDYFANPLIKELMKTDPNKAYAGAITYTTTSQGQKQSVRLPIADAMKAIGQDLSIGSNGEPLFSTIGKGTEAQQAIDRAGIEFKARFGRDPDPRKSEDNTWITKRAHEFTDKKDPATEEMQKTLLELRTTAERDRIASEKEKNAPLDVSTDVQTTMNGRRYLDLSTYQTPQAREKARQAAQTTGAIPVNKEVADGLRAADTAKTNLQAILAQVKPYLPKDASGRIIGGPANTLARVFQTNPTLGAYGSWRTAAIQAVQALAEKGMGLRLTRAEIDLMLDNDIPQLTDDWPTAQQRIKNLTSMLDTKERDALVRNRSSQESTPTAPEATPLDRARKKLNER